MTKPGRPPTRRIGFVVFAALAILLGTATAAAAHASLVGNTPGQSAHFATGAPPSSVSLTFDEDVTTTAKSIGVRPWWPAGSGEVPAVDG